MYRDFLAKAANGKSEPTKEMIPEVLREISQTVPKADFAYLSNLDGIFFGYKLDPPPQNLVLEMEIEIYSLDGKQREIFKQNIPLVRVLGDPMGWIKIRR